MKRRHKIAVILIFVLLSPLIFWGYIHSKPVTLATPGDLSEVRTGDIILTVGHSFKSSMVMAFERKTPETEEYSHIGLFIKNGDSTCIAHMSIDQGYIIKESITEFIVNNKVLKYDIYRINGYTLDTIKLHSIIDSLTNIRKPFDRMFDMHSEEAYYCTELVYKTFKKAGISEIERISYEKYLYPNEFVKSEIFTRFGE